MQRGSCRRVASLWSSPLVRRGRAGCCGGLTGGVHVGHGGPRRALRHPYFDRRRPVPASTHRSRPRARHGDDRIAAVERCQRAHCVERAHRPFESIARGHQPALDRHGEPPLRDVQPLSQGLQATRGAAAREQASRHWRCAGVRVRAATARRAAGVARARPVAARAAAGARAARAGRASVPIAAPRAAMR